MNKTILACALALALPVAVYAADPAPTPADGQWHGSGEAGLALASGNAKSQNVNAKLTLKKEDDLWKYDFFLEAQRNKANVTTATVGYDASGNPVVQNTTQYNLTANRYDAGASAGYKFDDRSYIVGALRYEHDAFSPYQYQYTASIGYGYQVLKNASDELSLEIGPGYKVQQPKGAYDYSVDPPVYFKADSDSYVVARGLVNYKHNFNETTSLVDTLLVEAGSENTFIQNDLGLQVKMSDRLALKAGYQVRHNTDIPPGSAYTKKTDQLLTTNLVYGF
ncbi:MAG: DUF481 domain-containing protein [Rudaea sp.]|uniref:DUF481 domain-containing protein n=1 Tax=Rudaea sp. TaxID=2136325 RepID=UPI0039E67BEC